MFKSFKQLISFRNHKTAKAAPLKNLKTTVQVHTLLKVRAAEEGVPITDLASMILYAALTTPMSHFERRLLEDLKTYHQTPRSSRPNFDL